MRAKAKVGLHPDVLPPAAFLLALMLVLLAYLPLLSPLGDSRLRFAFGDFTVNIGDESAAIRKDIALFTFVNGADSIYDKRFFLMESFALLSGWLPFSDSQFHSAIILSSVLLGSYGLYRIAGLFGGGPALHAMLALFLIPFYFMNEWGIDRIVHIWIWYTYAIIPLFLFMGISLAGKAGGPLLVAYSLLFSFFGFMPHSFLYLFLIHCFCGAYMALVGAKAKDLAKFALLPIAVYALMNLPALALSTYLSGGYPMPIDTDTLNTLSRHGDLLNLLSFSNNWWPRVPLDRIFENPWFRYSGMALFLALAGAISLSYGRLGRDGRILALLSSAAIAGSAFVALGMNNPAMPTLTGWAMDAGLESLLGLFREWARMCVLIPVFFSILAARCAVSLGGGAGRAFVLAMLSLIAINIAASPGWIYLNERYAPQYPDDEVFVIAARSAGDYKALWVEYLENRYNPSGFLGISKYGWEYDLPISGLIAHEELSGRLLDALGIRYAAISKNASTLKKGAYGFLKCGDLGHYAFCENENASGPFGAYRGAILVMNETWHLQSISQLPGGAYAPTINDTDFAAFAVWEDGANGQPGGVHPDKVGLGIIEAESFPGLERWKKYRVFSVNASGGGMLMFPWGAYLSKDIQIPKNGSYRLAVFGEGRLDAKIMNKTYDLDRKSPGFSFSPAFELESGIHALEVFIGQNSSLDTVWIYQVDDADSGMGLFENKGAPANATAYSKLDETRWDVELESSGPFLLAFRETYYPHWEARVYRDGELVQRSGPVRLFGAMSGFWINQTGSIDIEIRYLPQETYEGALVAPIATFLACAGFLAYAGLERRENRQGRTWTGRK